MAKAERSQRIDAEELYRLNALASSSTTPRRLTLISE
jgi:hypothetical protein